MEAIFNFFSGLGKDFALFVISMIPLIEERGAIIYGAARAMPWTHVLPICMAANMVPVPFILIFGQRLLKWLQTTRTLGPFFTRYEAKLAAKAATIDRYSFWALAIFVGIPLPGTGAWSGSLIAAMLNIRFRRALASIAIGVVMAGIIMTLGCYGAVGIFKLFV